VVVVVVGAGVVVVVVDDVEVVGWLGAAAAAMASTTSSTIPSRRAMVDPPSAQPGTSTCGWPSPDPASRLDVSCLDTGVTAYTHGSGRRLRVGPVTNGSRDGHGVGPIGGSCRRRGRPRQSAGMSVSSGCDAEEDEGSGGVAGVAA
jgi:hypothetical protein